MHDVVFSQNPESLNDLFEVNQSSFFRERSFFLHEFIKSSSITILIDEVKVVGSFEHIDILDNIGAVLKSREDVDLIDRAFLQFRYLSEFFCLHDFNSYFLFCSHVNCLIHFCVDSFTELLFKLVVLDYFPHMTNKK